MKRTAGSAVIAAVGCIGFSTPSAHLVITNDALDEVATNHMSHSSVNSAFQLLNEATSKITHLDAELYADESVTLSPETKESVRSWLLKNSSLGMPCLSAEPNGTLIGTWVRQSGARLVIRFVGPESIHYSLRVPGALSERIFGEAKPASFNSKVPEAMQLIA